MYSVSEIEWNAVQGALVVFAACDFQCCAFFLSGSLSLSLFFFCLSLSLSPSIAVCLLLLSLLLLFVFGNLSFLFVGVLL